EQASLDRESPRAGVRPHLPHVRLHVGYAAGGAVAAHDRATSVAPRDGKRDVEGAGVAHADMHGAGEEGPRQRTVRVVVTHEERELDARDGAVLGTAEMDDSLRRD